MKRRLFFIAGILLSFGIAIIYHFSYPIDSAKSNLDSSVRQWLNRGYNHEVIQTIHLYTPLTLDDYTYIPLEAENKLGYILLKRGLTGRYKILHSSRGTLSFYNGITDIDGEKYFLLLGKNNLGQISKAIISLATPYTYEVTIPKQNVFLVYIPVAQDVPIGPVSLEKIAFFAPDGTDVTESLNISSGSIR